MDIEGIGLSELLKISLEASAKGLGGKAMSDAYEKLKSSITKYNEKGNKIEEIEKELEFEINDLRNSLINTLKEGSKKIELESLIAEKGISVQDIRSDDLTIKNIKSTTLIFRVQSDHTMPEYGRSLQIHHMDSRL